MQDVIIFLITLLAPFVVIRFAIHVVMKRPHEPAIGILEGVRFHHLHLGILFVFLASLILVFTGSNIFSIGFLGLGLGLILDEFVASLVVPHQEPLSTKLYLGSFKATGILFIAIVVIVLAFFLALNFE